MNAFIDQDGCIACGQCYDVCPEVFSAGDNGIAFVVQEQIKNHDGTSFLLICIYLIRKLWTRFGSKKKNLRRFHEKINNR